MMTAWGPAAGVWKKSSKNLVRTARLRVIRVMPNAACSSGSASPAAILVKNSTPTARTNGSAYGSWKSGSGSRQAAARAAATSVAVAPTLDSRSQLSSSVRVILKALCAVRILLSQYNDISATLYDDRRESP